MRGIQAHQFTIMIVIVAYYTYFTLFDDTFVIQTDKEFMNLDSIFSLLFF